MWDNGIGVRRGITKVFDLFSVWILPAVVQGLA
jgi:hypothetical protein